MRDNTLSMEAALADGALLRFGPVSRDLARLNVDAPGRDLFRDLLTLGEREAAEVAARFPKVQRRVGGYNLDALVPNGPTNNMAHVLVGSEGTLAFTTKVELKLWPVIRNRVLGVCHFGSFYEAMDAAQHLVTLRPIAVELVDRTMIALGRDIAMFRPTVEAVVRGDPDALLIVEFAEEDQAENLRRLKRLDELMRDLGFGWDRPPRRWGGVVEVAEPALQAALAEFRTAGLNVMMSMKQAGKPVSFIEDCAVPLLHLAEYTERLTAIFEKHGTKGTLYAHASEGCLHVRPVLNLKLEKDVKTMRAIAEEAFAMVRAYKGSHSGEHGDGIVRSEFHEPMFGSRLVRAFEQVKARFDPHDVLNPGKIVHAPRMDDRSLFRYPPGYRVDDRTMALDWSAFPGAAGGFQGAVEMCNNNGACRKLQGGVMCPSYMATRNERDVTRGRANTLRLAISGQLGARRLHLGRGDGDAQAVRVLQGLPARMSDRRRHGQDEDRGPGGPRGEVRPLLPGPSRRLLSPLCRGCLGAGPLRQSAQPKRPAAAADGARRRHQRAARPSRVAARRVFSARDGVRAGERPRGRPVRRHLQPHLRAGEPGRRAQSAYGGRLPGPSRPARGGRPPALLRPHLPVRRVGPRGAGRA